ncbi:hypothetical protein GQ457_04G029760 [Hibiscus cannabinus]
MRVELGEGGSYGGRGVRWRWKLILKMMIDQKMKREKKTEIIQKLCLSLIRKKILYILPFSQKSWQSRIRVSGVAVIA